jgi:hypothetical protein
MTYADDEPMKGEGEKDRKQEVLDNLDRGMRIAWSNVI